MAGKEGIVQRLTIERDAFRRVVSEATENLDVLLQEMAETSKKIDTLERQVKEAEEESDALEESIQAIQATMNGHLTVAEVPTVPVNPFKAGFISWYAFNILKNAPDGMTLNEIYKLISLEKTCEKSGVYTALYAEREVFEHVGGGIYQLRRV